jgi:hypothetical protein
VHEGQLDIPSDTLHPLLRSRCQHLGIQLPSGQVVEQLTSTASEITKTPAVSIGKMEEKEGCFKVTSVTVLIRTKLSWLFPIEKIATCHAEWLRSTNWLPFP